MVLFSMACFVFLIILQSVPVAARIGQPALESEASFAVPSLPTNAHPPAVKRRPLGEIPVVSKGMEWPIPSRLSSMRPVSETELGFSKGPDSDGEHKVSGIEVYTWSSSFMHRWCFPSVILIDRLC